MEDGRTPELRRMMVEYGEQFWKSGLGASVRCPGRQSARRHAVAALRHVRDGRARAEPTRAASPGAARLDLRRARSGSRSSTSASTTSSTSRPGSRWPRASARRRPRRRRSRGGCRTRCRRSRRGRAHEQTRPGTGHGRRTPSRPRTTTSTKTTPARPASSPAAACSTLVRLPRRRRSPRSTSCCRSSPACEDTWHRIEDGSPCWMLARARASRSAMFGGYVTMFRGVFVRAGRASRIGWRESYQITMAGLAASRIFAAGGAGGLVLQAWALRRAGMRQRAWSPTRRSRSWSSPTSRTRPR